MKTYEEINEMAKMEEVGMRRNAGDQINTAFVHGFKNGEKLGHQEGYQQGLEDGKRQGVAIDGDKRYWDGYHAAQDDGRKIYQKGLDDAWTAARKIMLDGDDYLTYDKLVDIFGDIDPNRILWTFSPSEAVEKIREYEKKQKQEEAKERFREKLESGYFSGKQKQDCNNDKEWDSDSEACADSPCDLCKFNPPNPPGSRGWKPCMVCPAEGRD